MEETANKSRKKKKLYDIGYEYDKHVTVKTSTWWVIQRMTRYTLYLT